MRIGIFDSGLGGLLLAHAIQTVLPEYNYVYLGDTLHMPYGDRPQSEIFAYTKQAVEYLFNQDCQLIIVACNTASAEALRKIQMEYLPEAYPDRRVLGVLIPAAEMALQDTAARTVGVLATSSTVQSSAFVRELHKINPSVTILQQAAPALVPLIENATIVDNLVILEEYLRPFQDNPCDVLILGCTHYGIINKYVQDLMGSGTAIISQDEVVPMKLKDYLERHPEIENHLCRNGERRFVVTKSSKPFQYLADQFYGTSVPIEEVVV